MFKWDEKYSIGIEDIDEQHKGLFEIGNWLNELNLSELKNDHYIEVMIIINELLVYSNDHFKDEEAYMKQVKYPKLEDHIKIHQRFIDYVASFDFEVLYEQGEVMIESLFTFINRWIVQHIMNEDQKIQKYVNDIERS